MIIYRHIECLSFKLVEAYGKWFVLNLPNKFIAWYIYCMYNIYRAHTLSLPPMNNSLLVCSSLLPRCAVD